MNDIHYGLIMEVRGILNIGNFDEIMELFSA